MSATTITQSQEAILTPEELSSLKTDVRYFFVNYPIPNLKKLLWDLYSGWVYSSADHVNQDDIRDMLFFYEQLGDFVNDSYRLNTALEEKKGTAPFDSKIVEQNDEIQAILDLIILAVKPQMIFKVVHPTFKGKNDPYVDLLIITPNDLSSRYRELEPVIELATIANEKISCSLYQHSYLIRNLQKGHLFFSWACTKENLVYDKGNHSIPALPIERFADLITIADLEFKTGMARANNFYTSAKSNFEAGHLQIVMFLLHQSVELTFRTVALALYGTDEKSHSVKSLKKLNRRLAPQLNDIFPADTDEEERLLKLLDDAYADSRYKPDYTVEAADVEELLARCARLPGIAGAAMKENLKLFDLGE